MAATGSWSSLGGTGSGLNGLVLAIAKSGAVIYAGGEFVDAGGDPDADYIAKFENGAWSSIGGAGSGLNASVSTIVIDGSDIYAGGAFINAGGDPDADRIAVYSAGVWQPLNDGLNDDVHTIALDGGIVYAGGAFINAGGDPDGDFIAMYDAGSWSSLGGAGTGLDDPVNTLVFNGGDLYAGGSFFNAGLVPDADSIAKFSGGAWSSLGVGSGLGDTVTAILFDGSDIYASGYFVDAGGDLDADFVAKFDGSSWSAVGSTPLDDFVQALAWDGGELIIGGGFSNAGGDAEADNVAKLGGDWVSLGGAGGLNDEVYELLSSGGALYAGGQFNNAGGDADADNIAQFGLNTAGSSDSNAGRVSKEINSSGSTTLQFGRILVTVPASAIPSGESNCKIVIQTSGDSGAYGFTLDDSVWSVKVICDSGEQNLFFAPISVCIRPVDGVLADKQVFHKHAGGVFTALGSTGETAGYVCAQTRSLSLFTLGTFGLPSTGFAPGRVSSLETQPADYSYTSSDLILTIPALKQEMRIVGVPQGPNGWDVSWLDGDAGYLQGTAFPTMAGNTVLTAHVWNADNTPGPFAGLNELQYGDRFSITAWGQTYVYEVRANRLFSAQSVVPLQHEDYDWVTLITCQYFDETTGEYTFRRAVRAVLVSVE